MKKIASLLLLAASVAVSACQLNVGSGYWIKGKAFPYITHINNIPVTNAYEHHNKYDDEYQTFWVQTPQRSTVSTNTPFTLTIAWSIPYDLGLLEGNLAVGLTWLDPNIYIATNPDGTPRPGSEDLIDPELLDKTIELRVYISEDDGSTWELYRQQRFSSIELLKNHSRLLNGKIFTRFGGSYPPGKTIKIRLCAGHAGNVDETDREWSGYDPKKTHLSPWTEGISHTVTVTITGDRVPGRSE